MILAVVGPTCSGKSSLAIELAKYFDAEIINFDPYQCYEELQIGVAKPSDEELKIVRHHLFSFIPVSQDFTIYDFQKVFRETLKSLQNLNKNVILVGGSGLYLRSAIYDYEFSETKVVEEENYNSFTNDELFAQLKMIDPESCEKIHPNNRKRVLRALELALSNEQKGTKKKPAFFTCMIITENNYITCRWFVSSSVYRTFLPCAHSSKNAYTAYSRNRIDIWNYYVK